MGSKEGHNSNQAPHPPDEIRGGDRLIGCSFAGRSKILAPHGMAATSQPLATQAALRILEKGGHAVDAAIAANAVLGLTEPMSCGLGGDLFALIWDANEQRLYGLNASGRSSASLDLKVLRQEVGTAIPLRGPLAVSVPGAVDGWAKLHQRFGCLPWGDLFAPTISYAVDGFPVSDLSAHHWRIFAPPVIDQPGFREAWTVNGATPHAGHRLRNKDLAESLEKIATEGSAAFYEGPFAERIVQYLRACGGHLTREDFASHRSTWDDPISASYRGFDVWQLPPNGQGIAVLQMLNLLEGFDLSGMGFGSGDHLHHLIEAIKLVFEDRARWYADPSFADLPIAELISKPYAEERRQLIHPQRALPDPPCGNPRLGLGDTVCIVTADRHRNLVSLMQSIFLPMGSGVTPPGLGFMMQNRGASFALDEQHPNAYAPGKRPFHTIIPAFVTENDVPYLSFGVMGGDAQPQGEVQILLNLIDFGMDLQEAGDAPRLLLEGYSKPTGEAASAEGHKVLLESGFPAQSMADLVRRGHQAVQAPAFYGGYQAIRYDRSEDVYHGASECRQDGHAAGY